MSICSAFFVFGLCVFNAHVNVKYLITHTHTHKHTLYALDKVNVITVLYKTMTLTPAAFEVLHNSIEIETQQGAKHLG